ncbi:MAG: bifunctional (p)ppGpp synthetase/guanosine-3',5'-bis(diphosphate) 3'-pyrophosphohydrolase [Bacteroidales bacterium]|nr:bifunctional (p)ppGpp synthetase/guanosine-3',5'-bis(diphosphate) 3'-pyrophosphohydrolase [Bacteroidales bacterium]
MSFSKFTQADYDAIEAAWSLLKDSASKRCATPMELEVVQEAFEFANNAHKDIRRRSGEPYMLHPIAVARIVVEDIGLGHKSIAAALLHDVVEDTDYTVEDIKERFGSKIASLVDGLTKIKNLLDNRDNDLGEQYVKSIQAENFKRILLTLNDDVRVVLIKLADRLHNCRTIEYMPEYKRDKILSETMFIFIPLAHQLGLYSIKSEMENIWLKYKEPDAYNEITAKIDRNVLDKDASIDEFIAPIRSAMEEAGFNFEIRKRVKTPYSIWKKMNSKNISFDQIYDLYAIRIIFDPSKGNKETERDQCYHVFSIVTTLYRYKPDRMRDWVKHPKSNGYEALHCTVLDKSGIWVEVQIRTRRMDDIAEKGIAAHWAYTQDGYVEENDSEMEKWLGKVKEILVNPDVNALELLDIIHNDLTTSTIMLFTPKGDQRAIQKGATVLDFAYLIHTEIGNHAIAAKVNMKLVPLNHVLHSGDQVEIITAEDELPKKEWLQFLKTRHARNIVLDWFRSEKDLAASTGRKNLDEELSSMGIKTSDELYNQVASNLQLSGAEDLFFRYYLGLFSADAVAMYATGMNLEAKSTKRSKWLFPWFKKEEKAPVDDKNYVIGSPVDHHKYIIASCCNPIAGDAVVGFRSPDGTISVHKKTCQVAQGLAAKHGDWIVSPRWAESDGLSFLARVYLQGVDRVGLLNEITRYISLVMEVNIKKLVLGSEHGVFEGYMDLYVKDKGVLDTLMQKLSGIDGLKSVRRTEMDL